MKSLLFVMPFLLCSTAVAERVSHQFGVLSDGDPAWQRRFNSQLDHFRLEPGGWSIDYAPVNPEAVMKPGGFRSVFQVQDNFVATLRFHVDRIGIPPTGSGAGVLLRVRFGEDHVVTCGQFRTTDGAWFVRGKCELAGQRQPFEFGARRPQQELQIVRDHDNFIFRCASSGSKPKDVFVYQASSPIESPGTVEVFVTSDRASVPMKMTVQSIVVESSDISPGSPQELRSSRSWMYSAALFTIIGIGCYLVSLRQS